jgi:hypothetical protein
MSIGLIITLAGLGVAGFSSLLGVWLERDDDKPKKIAVALSTLIVLATGVGMVQAMMDEQDKEKMEGDLARMLQTLDKIASSSDIAIPELDALVKSELSAQSRNNPDVVKKMAQRVADEGGDPNAMLGNYLSASEVQSLGRKGELKVKPPAVAVVAVGKDAEKPRDRVRPTLADVASGKAPPPSKAAPPTAAPTEPPAPPTLAAAPPTEAPTAAPPPMVAAVRKAPPALKSIAPPVPKPAAAAFSNFKAPPTTPAAAAGAAQDKAKAEAEAKKKAAEDAAKAKEAEAKKKAEDAKKKAEEEKKKAEAAAKKKIEDAKKKIPKAPW